MSSTSTGIRHATISKPKKSHGLRPDIQGLRALAVLAVIADHTFAYPHGGFVGVDVFFVISGFLITGLLLREHERSGRISFADFYRKRARRILPLAVLVLVATVAASWAVFNSGRAMKITEDALWSLVFGTNWHLALIGTDYMQAGGAVSPLQHFWSLAVEEQFYVVWPWLIVLVLGAAVKAGWSKGRSRVALTVTMAALTVAAFAFALWETANNPTVAYFSTFSRAWELGIGAVLAASFGALAKIPQALRPVLAYVGLAGIVWSIFAITPEMPFPAPWAVVPVLATALVIAAGVGGADVRHLSPLTNPVSRYIGDISYSLYLWHFPAIVLFGAILPVEGPLLFGAIIAAAGLMSVLSYHLLEDPIRKSGWLEPKGKGLPSTDVREKAALGGLVALALVTTCVVGSALAQDAASKNVVPVAAPAPLAATGKDAPKTLESEHTTKLNAALAAAEWPGLTPSIDNLGQGAKASEWVTDGCLGGDSPNLEADIAKAETCVYGDPAAAKTAVVVGDSIAISYVPTVRAALEPKGYKVVVHTMQQCPAVMVTVMRGDKSEHSRCDPFRQWAYDQVKATKPDLLILSSSEDGSMRLASKAEGPAVASEWREGTKESLTELTGAAGRIVILDPPTGGKALQECATRLSKPSDCVTSPDNRYGELYSAVRDAVTAVPGAKAEVIRTRDWFCSRDSCPGFVGTTPVYADQGHMTPDFAASLAPLFSAALKL